MTLLKAVVHLELLRHDARAQGAPQLSTESQRILNRVKKLLALAESQETNEAELAARQAQSLIVKHHLNEHLNPIDEDPLNQICAKQITAVICFAQI